MSKVKNILLIAYYPSHLNEMIRVVDFLDQYKYRSYILYTDNLISLDVKYYQTLIKGKKASLININGDKLDQDKNIKISLNQKDLKDSKKSIIAAIKEFILVRPRLKNFIVKMYRAYLYIIDFPKKTSDTYEYYIYLKNKIRLTNNLYQKIKPDFVILPEDNVFLNTGIFIKTAKDLSISTAIIPYTVANQAEFADSFYPTNEVKGMTKFFAYFFPKWIYTHKKRRLILMPIWKIMVNEILHLAPPDPWLMNSGFADAILTESPQIKNYLYKSGIPSVKLKLTGSINDLTLQKGLQKADVKRKKLGYKPLILCALPTCQLAKLDYEYKNYILLIEFWVKSLIEIKDFDVIFSLHPNINYEEIKYLEKIGAKFTRGDIVKLIPECDIYIACISATIRWAIACGKPVINYDVYKYRYHDYDNAKGVITIEKKEDFKKILKKMTTNKKYYQEMKEKQEKCAPDWGMLDGKSGQRILNLIEKLIEEKHAK